jgi:hypothetical protein
MKLRLRRPSPALVLAGLALFVALGGTGYAVTKLHGKNLVNRSVSGVKLKRDAVTKTEVKEASIAAAGTIMNGRPGPLPFEATFMTSGGPIVILASGSGFSASGARVLGMDVLVDGLVRGEARVYTNEASSHRAFVTSGIPVTGLKGGTHTLRLVAHTGTQTDGNDFFTVTVLEQSLAAGIGADRWEEDDTQVARHGGACKSIPDTLHSGAATIWPAGDDDWWWSEWSWISAGEIELKVLGGPRMDVYLWSTSTRIAQNVKTFRKSSVTEWYDLRVDNPNGVPYVVTCRLIPAPAAAGATGATNALVRPGG